MLTGTIARQVFNEIIDGVNVSGIYPEPYVKGYFPEEQNTTRQGFAAFDNTTKNCWTEWFGTETEAIAWCEGRIEAPGL